MMKVTPDDEKSRRRRRRLSRPQPLVLLLLLLSGVCNAAVECETSRECEAAFLDGSECLDGGVCSNPFFKNGGCLKGMLPEGWHKVRTCGSDDPPEASARGYCRPSPLNYMEVRILSRNWDSHIFGAWILQILLQEVLDVPVSLETHSNELNMDFYNPHNAYGHYHHVYDRFAGFENALKAGGDCRDHVYQTRDEDDDYKPCWHVNPEIWDEDIVTESLRRHDIVEGSMDVGMVAAEHWYIPRYTAREYPSVVSYLGLSGDRQKLASIFKRPATWAEYCIEVSKTLCSTPDDGIATRAPHDAEEGERYFVPGLYTGHFRATKENNCTARPTTCTGLIVDYPCGWTSFVKPRLYHLNISLRGSGYEPNKGYKSWQMREIWRAANATKSHVIMQWWNLEPLYKEFLETEYEFIPVVLPPPSQQCKAHRIPQATACSSDYEDPQVVGEPEGVCENQPKMLQKLIGGGIRERTQDPSVPTVEWSPAVDLVENYRISALDMGDIYSLWEERGIDTFGFDPRYAVCKWVVDNFDDLQSFVPASFPRIVVEEHAPHSALFHGAVAMAAISVLMAIGFGSFVYLRRRKKAIYNAQAGFVVILLSGLGLVSVGALLMVLPPSTGTCTSLVWLVNLGFAIELAPLAKKLDTIVRAAIAGKGMQRVRLSKMAIYGSALAASCLVGSYLIAWTIVDTPSKGAATILTEDVNENGETILIVTYHCASESFIWFVFSIAWQGAVLLFALLLAFIASRVREGINDARDFTVLVVSHCTFMAIRVAIVSVARVKSIEFVLVTRAMSLCLSADCILAMLIFVAPKLCDNSDNQESDEIMPELFVQTTILIADISGFTAWSSVRDPTQVFKFLDSVYLAFDDLAEKRNVFKVETVRDCYVAAAGIPKVQKDHAATCARFATDIMLKMSSLSRELEITFGPDTSDLSLRIGLNSGPSTGGFVKGRGSRFQLLGDTVTLAVNIERSGEAGKIHLSENTASLLIKEGYGDLLKVRDPPVFVKAKGEVTTFWLNGFGMKSSFVSTGVTSNDHDDATDRDEYLVFAHNQHEANLARRQRLVEWNVEVLGSLLKQIVARRNAKAEKDESSLRSSKQYLNSSAESATDCLSRSGHQFEESDPLMPRTMPLDEVQEIIELPEFNRKIAKRVKGADSIILEDAVQEQLKDLASTIASMYNNNPFHSYAHASHVVQAVIKMMGRIVGASDLDLGEGGERKSGKAAALHDHTYGITSDPLTQFACAFSALIHDLDHPGVPNPQLIKESPTLSATYRSRSVAEQNSFDLAWDLFMNDRFTDLRWAVCGSKGELQRFRQLVVNSVMATDLGDQELKKLRNARWDKAFNVSGDTVEEAPRDAVNRKATIVIEHIIQAADVSHTMQHWHVYREWNEKLFREMYYAYKAGRSDKDPATFWYEGEIGFFDFYIIPLSKKLADCGVFGVTSDENLNYAMNNRAEWVAKGQEVVAEMVEKLRREEVLNSASLTVLDQVHSLDSNQGDSSDAGEEPELLDLDA